MRESQWYCSDGRLAFGELGIDRPCDLDVHVSFFEITAANTSRGGNGRPNTQRSSASRFNIVSARDELYFAGAEHVVDMDAELGALLASLGDSQLLGWRSQNRQLGRCIGAELHFCVGAGSFNIVRDCDAGLEFVAGSGQHRHTRRYYKRSTNERVAVG